MPHGHAGSSGLRTEPIPISLMSWESFRYFVAGEATLANIKDHVTVGEGDSRCPLLPSNGQRPEEGPDDS